MSERLPCQTSGCAATILSTTVLKTGGICMPCLHKKLALEKDAYISKNRIDVDRYKGIIDPVEILKIMHTPREYNPLENNLPYHRSAQELYHQLTEAERERLETYAISLIDQGDFDQAEIILLSLVCFTNARIEQGLDAFFQKGKYYPGILYKEAGPAIRDELIQRVERDSANRNHLLLALSWIGDEEVIRLFARWRQNPPRWASKLYVPPENYAHEAGWKLDEDGRKRLLFHPESYHYKVCEEGDGIVEPAQSAVMALQTDEQGLWCKALIHDNMIEMNSWDGAITLETELDLFKWKQYESEVILLTVRWYLKYSLSYRDLVEMMEERGLGMAHTTIMRWVHEFGPELDKRIRPYLKQTNDSFRTDETYIKIKGQWKYLYRAVDSKGNTIDFMLSENRDASAAKQFFKKALTSTHSQSPRVITVDKNPAYPIAVQQLKDEKSMKQETLLRQKKYLNNIIEQDHRFIKKIIKPMLGFKSFETAEYTIAGIEVMHMLRKGQVELIHSSVLSSVEIINKIFGLTA